MEVRGKVAEAGKIDFIGPHYVAQGRFHGKHGCHQMRSFESGKIGHFLYMLRPDYAAEARIVGIIGQHYPAARVLPEEGAANLGAQLANRIILHNLSFIRNGDS